MSAEAFQYFELWSNIEAAGGSRLGQFLSATRPQRRRNINGDDALVCSIGKTHPLVASIARGAVLREVLSLDGTVVREWPIMSRSRASGDTLVVTITCAGMLTLLTNYPVTSADIDGFVYNTTAAMQLPVTSVISSYTLSNTPSYMAVGTVTPSGNIEVPFSNDSALSGQRRVEQVSRGYETSLRRNGSTQYLVDYTALGAGSGILYLRTGKNLRQLKLDDQPSQVTRVNQITGAAGDDGPAGIQWAYWEVVSVSGTDIVLKAIHGGDGPIKYDNQLNHANLPGGANSLYLEKRDGTFTQITASVAATQTLTVASATTITAGDWVRIVASSTGRHLMSLDAPTELAANGVLAGNFTSNWDDTVAINKNALQEDWTGAAPTGWTKATTAAKTTTAGEWVSAGWALKVNDSLAPGGNFASCARSWYIRPRRTIWSASALIRPQTIGPGITLQVKVGSTVIASIDYLSPANQWKLLKIEGIDLGAYVGTTQTLTIQLVQGATAGTLACIVDSMNLTPTYTVRAMTTGSNAARTYQDVNGFLDDNRTLKIAYSASAIDLAALGVANQVVPDLGMAAVVDDDETGTASVRIVQIDDVPGEPGTAEYTLSNLPARLSREPSKPLDLVIPFFEPIQLQIAGRDTRNAALICKAQITATAPTTVTVSLLVYDTLGNTPTIAADPIGTTIASGSGTGPYVIDRPAHGAGTARVVFTASILGRNSEYDAIDVPEQGIDLTSSLPSGTKSVRLSPAGLIPFGNYALAANTDTSVQSASGANVEQYQCALDMLPEGCTITGLTATMLGGVNFVQVALLRNDGTVVGSAVTSAGSIWNDFSTSLSEAIGTGGSANKYSFLVSFQSGSVPADRQLKQILIHYTSPNLQATT